jgi:hypothetical protein
VAQESEVTKTTTTEEYVAGGEDLLSQLWFFEDATPLDPGQLDLRFGFHWWTASGEAALGDASDDFILEPTIVWGPIEDLELSLTTYAWVGDGGDMGSFDDGNYDSRLGMLWRFFAQEDYDCGDGCLHLPSMALSASARIPTGCGSSGMDGELRLVMTYEYDNGVRSHFNIWGKAVDGDNHESAESLTEDAFTEFLPYLDEGFELDPRHFQYGATVGADGPLCADGAVRWVADYTYRSSYYYGQTGLHFGEVGWEWEISDVHKLGMSVQAGLDHASGAPNWGAGLMYAYSIMY